MEKVKGFVKSYWWAILLLGAGIWYWWKYVKTPDWKDATNNQKLVNAMFEYKKATEGVLTDADRAVMTSKSTPNGGFWNNPDAMSWFGVAAPGAGGVSKATEKQKDDLYKLVKEYFK